MNNHHQLYTMSSRNRSVYNTQLLCLISLVWLKYKSYFYRKVGDNTISCVTVFVQSGCSFRIHKCYPQIDTVLRNETTVNSKYLCSNSRLTIMVVVFNNKKRRLKQKKRKKVSIYEKRET